jgi:hypothetical protein
MSKTATTENLILYYFNETALTESVLVQREIDQDPETEAEYENMKRSFRFVDQALCDPSRKSVERILRYAAITAPEVN